MSQAFSVTVNEITRLPKPRLVIWGSNSGLSGQILDTFTTKPLYSLH